MASSENDLRLAPGTIVDQRYKIVMPIKAGGMGAVYRAVDLKLGEKPCAIKEMLDRFETPYERQCGIDRFLAEVAVMEHLAHANIPRVTDHFLEKNNFYFVMEYIEGTDLSSLLKKEGNPGLPWERVVGWGLQVLDALNYAHGLKEPVIHRDIKPSNLMLRHADNRLLIIDFGIARVTNPGPHLWIGTREYAPPEQQLGRHGRRSDLFALGVTMHELMTGRTPDGVNVPEFTESEREGLPASLVDVMFRAVRLWPEERYQSAADMRDALVAVLGYTPEVTANASFAFTESVARLKEMALDAPLRKLIARYPAECQTPHLPRQLELFEFTLGLETPFQLIVVLNESQERVDFYERQGLLEARLLGSVDPRTNGAPSEVVDIVERYERDYETFKNGWQGMFAP